jgi:hypothetical protein
MNLYFVLIVELLLGGALVEGQDGDGVPSVGSIGGLKVLK